MTEFRKLKLRQFAQVQDRETSESKFWKSYKTTTEEKLQGAANTIHFDPTESGSYIVTASTRVSLFDSGTDSIQRAYTRFKDEAYSGHFRRDGRLIVAGDKAGYIKVFDVQSKSVLRQLKGHTAAARATAWSGDALHMLSGSDDKSVKLWDLGSEDVVWENKVVHTDYVRSVCASTVDNNVFVSGSYDHSICLWDQRQSTVITRLDHGRPVTKCLMTPSGGMLLTAGGNEIKLWDLMNSGRLLHTFANHQKDISDIFLTLNGLRLLSSGLDGHVKVYDFQKLQVVHGMKFSDPILSVALSPNSRKLVVGFVNGNLEIKNHDGETNLTSAEDDGTCSNVFDSSLKSGHARFYSSTRSAGLAGSGEVVQVEAERVQGLRPYEAMLKKFNYQGALDAALKSRNPVVVVTVLEELSRRSGLVIALSGRDELSLEPILAFLARYVSNPRYCRLIVQVTHVVLDLYSSVLGRSDAIDELFHKLHKQIRAEVSFQRQVMPLLGSLDGIITSSLISSRMN